MKVLTVVLAIVCVHSLWLNHVQDEQIQKLQHFIAMACGGKTP